MKYLKNVTSIEGLKKEYRKLAMQHHPDKGGDQEIFKAIVNEYELLLSTLQAQETKENNTAEHIEMNARYKNIIDNLIMFEGLTIEVANKFIWISGNTYHAKDKIKEIGGKWASKKKMWYFSPEGYKRKGGGEFSYNDIKAAHGIQASFTTKGNFKPVLN